jgi:shikimate kinase
MQVPPAGREPTGDDGQRSARDDRWLAGTGDGTDPDRHMHVVVLGLPGAGTSTVGRLLANRLQRPYVDHDSIVGLGRPTDGSDDDREADLDALRRVLAAHGSVVYGAGSHVAEHARPEDLAGAYVVWLDATPDVVAERIRGRDHPVLGSDPLKSLREMDAEIAPKAREMCDLRVSVDETGPDQAAEHIGKAWRRRVEELSGRAPQGRAS